MLLKLIEKKGEPVKTKVQFDKKEWKSVPGAVKEALGQNYEKHETKRLIYFIVEGDLINPKNRDERPAYVTEVDWSEEEQEDSNDGGTIRKGRIFK